MKKLKMYKNKSNDYLLTKKEVDFKAGHVEEIKDKKLSALHEFLSDYPLFYVILDWLENKDIESLSGDSCEMIKDGDNILISYIGYFDERDELGEWKDYFISIKRDDLKDLVRQWFEKFLNIRPENRAKEMTIILHDDGHVTIETKD